MRCYSVRWLTAGLCRPLRTAKTLPSTADGKLTKLVSLPGSTVACHVASLPFAADGKEPFAVGGRWQRGHVAPTYASWGMDHLANLPTVADVTAKLMAKTLPLPSAVADGKKQRALTHC